MVDSVQKLRPVDLFQRVDPVRGFDGVGPVGRIGGIVRLVRLPRVGDVVAVCRLVPDPVVGAVRSVGPVRTVVADAGNGAWVSGPVPRWQCPAPSGTDARRGRHRCRSSRSRLVRPRPTSSSAFDRLAGLVRTSSASSRASIAASLCSSCSCVTSWGWASRPSTSEFRCGASERRSLIRMPSCRHVPRDVAMGAQYPSVCGANRAGMAVARARADRMSGHRRAGSLATTHRLPAPGVLGRPHRAASAGTQPRADLPSNAPIPQTSADAEALTSLGGSKHLLNRRETQSASQYDRLCEA